MPKRYELLYDVVNGIWYVRDTFTDRRVTSGEHRDMQAKCAELNWREGM